MTVHIIGAGLAGLSCALASADAGHPVVLHESARQAGGRCRSWYDPTLERVIDNGTHMVVGANVAVFSFLRRIGAELSMAPGPSEFPMRDLASGKVWTATPARLIGSILASTWRLPRHRDSAIGAALGRSRNYQRFWDPLALAIMNTPADQASALVFRRVLARTLWRGAKASQPFLARDGLSSSFIAPAIDSLAHAGVELRLNHPLRGLTRDGGRATGLSFDDETISLAEPDRVVLATSGSVARSLLPELPELPVSPIVNAHFRLAGKPPALPGGFVGLLGGMAQWLFVKDDVVSVTVSGARDIVDLDNEHLAAFLWQDAARCLSLTTPPIATRVIKEKRATLWHSPAVEALRPVPRVMDNLILAGDWTATGLPCTLEGALTSGTTAARLLFS